MRLFLAPAATSEERAGRVRSNAALPAVVSRKLGGVVLEEFMPRPHRREHSWGRNH